MLRHQYGDSELCLDCRLLGGCPPVTISTPQERSERDGEIAGHRRALATFGQESESKCPGFV